jgi:hypothetical protein
VTSYRIEPGDRAIEIEIAGVGDGAERLMAAFGECAEGRCSCPTDEYRKLESMEVAPSGDAISIRLEAKAGSAFDTTEIERCLEHTVEQAKG